MGTIPARGKLDSASEPDRSSIRGALRELIKLSESSGSECVMNACGEGCTEVILVDAEVDGARYLLVRMPKPDRNRIQLSPREHEIVRMVAKGHPNKVIADVLNISSWTVCTHLRRIFAKMGVGSRAAMVAKLLEGGVLSTDAKASSAGFR